MLSRLLVQDMIITEDTHQVVDMRYQVIQNVGDIQMNVILLRHFQEEKNIVDLQVHPAEVHIGAVLVQEAQEA